MRTLVACFTVLVLVGLSGCVADDTSSIDIVWPQEVIDAFPNGINNNPALFGMPPRYDGIYGVMIDLSLFTYLNVNDTQRAPPEEACFEIDPNSSTSYANARQLGNVIALIKRSPAIRSNCTFTKKMSNAQNMGANAAIVYNPIDLTIPYMKDDGSGKRVSIPSMMISGSDGARLSDFITNYYDLSPSKYVYVDLTYFIPRPDGRVELDMYSMIVDISNTNSTSGTITLGPLTQFRTNFGQAARALGSSMLFTPILSFVTLGSMSSQCTNNGRYCYQGNLPKNYADPAYYVVQEAIRQQALWYLLQAAGASHNLFTYYEQYYGPGGCGNLTVNDYSEDCSLLLITNLNAANAWSNNTKTLSITGAMVKALILSFGGYSQTATTTIPFIELNMASYTQKAPLINPAAYINNYPAYGSINCLSPISINSCQIVSGICAGYFPSLEPSVCLSPPDCPLGQTKDRCSVCNGTNECLTGSGVSLGVLFAFVVVMVLAVSALVYYCNKKQNRILNNDIDSILTRMKTGGTLGEGPTAKQTKAAMKERFIEEDSQEHDRDHSDSDQNIILDSSSDDM